MKRIRAWINSKKYHYLIVDEIDYARLSKYRWRIKFRRGNMVIYHSSASKRYYIGHEIIRNVPSGMVIDHINQNRLDNRRSNIRVCTVTENNRNKGVRKDNKSGYKGVRSINGVYRAIIEASGKRYRLGVFRNKKDAARAYNKKAIELYGEYAWLNPV